jgi:hypothetical protein
MARLIERPVDVTTGRGRAPVAFRWNGRYLRVAEVLDRWVEAGRWWEGEGEQATWRVATTSGGVYELTWRSDERRWFLYKAYD